MKEQRFIELLGVYGADLQRWPDGEREDAEAMLVTASHRIKDIWESERVFDRLLSLERDTLPSVALERRILASSPARSRQPSRQRGLSWLSRPQWAAGGAIAASLLLGVAAGYAAEPAPQSDAQYAEMLSLTGAGAGAVFLSAMNEPEN